MESRYIDMIAVAVFLATVVTHADSTVPGINAVVDLSHWNADVDFAKAKADGIQGVMHKATQGGSYVDKEYSPRKRQAATVGIHWGAYHFGDGTSGVKQANHFLQTVGNDPNTLLALDIEENSSQINLTIAEDFVRTVYKARGRYPMVYGSALLKSMVKGKKTILLNCPLWIAQWGPQAVIPEDTWTNWTLWQYTDGQKGPLPHTVNGIGHCDRDTVNSDVHKCLDCMWRSAGYPTSGTQRPETTTTPSCGCTNSAGSTGTTPESPSSYPSSPNSSPSGSTQQFATTP